MSSRLTNRDLEVLRTLVRVQFATTASLQRTFFPDLRLARRRLAALRNTYGVITPHTKGLPGNYAACGGRYWRITETGLGAFRAHFPHERVPENHITRTRNASLRFFEHRDATTDLYLRLIGSKDQHVEDLQSRADAIDWRAEHDVVLEYQSVEGAQYKQRKVVPDATLATPHARFFIEADRSTESLRYCKRSLAAYVNAVGQPAYRQQFPDELPIVVVYTTKTRARAENLRSIMDSFATLPFRTVALPVLEAVDWLSESVTEPPGPLVSERGANDAATELLKRLYSVCNERMKAGLRIADDPDLAPTLRDIYGHLASAAKGAA